MALKKPIAHNAGRLAEIGAGDYVDPAVLGSGVRNGTKFLRDDGTWQTVEGGTGGGEITAELATSGTTVLDFGQAPGGNMAVATVSDPEVGANSHADAWLMGVESADHNAYEHLIVPIIVRVGNIVPGVGFDVVGTSFTRLTGQFAVQWVRTN